MINFHNYKRPFFTILIFSSPRTLKAGYLVSMAYKMIKLKASNFLGGGEFKNKKNHIDSNTWVIVYFYQAQRDDLAGFEPRQNVHKRCHNWSNVLKPLPTHCAYLIYH